MSLESFLGVKLKIRKRIAFVAALTLISSLSVAIPAQATGFTWSHPGASLIPWTFSADSNPGGRPSVRFTPRSVAFGNGTFVAVSENYQTDTAVETSVDGNIWIPRTADINSTWFSVTYGGGLFVAVGVDSNGQDGVAMSSPDGITWTSVAIPTNQTRWQSITYANGRFVAIGQNSYLPNQWAMTSVDGINWTFGTGGADSNWSSVTYGNGLFVAVGQSGDQFLKNCIMTSPDGLTWTVVTTPDDSNWQNIAFGEGIFLAVSQGYIMKSSDGVTWESILNNPNQGWSLITYANGKFVISGYENFGSLIAVSDDGSHWVYQDLPVGRDWMGFAFGNNRLVMVNYEGNKIFSNLTESVPTYSLTVSSRSYTTNQPYTSACDSCNIPILVELTRSDGGLLQSNFTEQVNLTVTGAATQGAGFTYPYGSDTAAMSWGSILFNPQGPGDGSAIGRQITFHAEVVGSNPIIQGELTIPFVANDGTPTISAANGSGGVYVNITPANQALPDSSFRCQRMCLHRVALLRQI